MQLWNIVAVLCIMYLECEQLQPLYQFVEGIEAVQKAAEESAPY